MTPHPSPEAAEAAVHLSLRALISKWRHAAEHLGLDGLASLADCADELEAALASPASAEPYQPLSDDDIGTLENDLDKEHSLYEACGQSMVPARQFARMVERAVLVRVGALAALKGVSPGEPGAAPAGAGQPPGEGEA